MKEWIMIWFASLGLTLGTVIFSQIIIPKYIDTFWSIFCILLPIAIEICSIVMVFKTKENLGKKIMMSLFLPSSIYLYFIIIVIFAVIIPLFTGGFNSWT